MTSILIHLMLTICSPQQCTDCTKCIEQPQITWEANSTNALTIALAQCDNKAKMLEQEDGGMGETPYYRCTIGKE